MQKKPRIELKRLASQAWGWMVQSCCSEEIRRINRFLAWSDVFRQVGSKCLKKKKMSVVGLSFIKLLGCLIFFVFFGDGRFEGIFFKRQRLLKAGLPLEEFKSKQTTSTNHEKATKKTCFRKKKKKKKTLQTLKNENKNNEEN